MLFNYSEAIIMPKENASEGISTIELCVESKKYLSRLLVGKTGIKPDFLTWDLLLTEKLYLDTFVETGEENLEQLIKAKSEWNRLLNENELKSTIQTKLILLECRSKQEEYIQSRQQQEDFRSRKQGLIAIGMLLTLIIGYIYFLPLLSTAATFVGVLCLGLGATLVCCSIVPAFVGESLIDPEWYKEYSIEREKHKQIITQKIKGIAPSEIANEQTQSAIIRPLPIQNQSIELIQIGRPTDKKPSTSNNSISKKPQNTRYSFFAKEKLTEHSRNTLPIQMIIYTSAKLFN